MSKSIANADDSSRDNYLADLLIAAHNFAQVCFCAGPTCSGCEKATEKIFIHGADWAYNELAKQVEQLKAERDALNEVAMQMDSKYWAEFNRHEQTKSKLAIATPALEEIAIGKQKCDVDHPDIVLAGRLWSIAREALSKLNASAQGDGDA